MGRIANEWAVFAERILPANAPSVQKIETKRAYYAGAFTILGLLTDIVGPDEEPTDAEVAELEAIHEECRRFFKDVERGKA
jgi:hypothetical protein